MMPYNAKTYIQDATRTESTGKTIQTVVGQNYRVVHALFGLITEAGELTDVFKRHFFYGQSIDLTNIDEEIGDLFWYIAVLLDHAGFNDITKCMEANINKLKKRYPNKFTEEDAAEENRDREAEKQEIEKVETDSETVKKWETYTRELVEENKKLKKQLLMKKLEGLERRVNEVEAKKIADTKRFICHHCKGPLSGETIRLLFSPPPERKMKCPNCIKVLSEAEVIEIK